MKIWFADTEDNSADLFEHARKRGKVNDRTGFEKKLTCVAAIRNDGEEFFARGSSSGEKFLNMVRREKPERVYFHNLSYDLGSLLGQHSLDAFDVAMVGSRMIKARWGGTTFLDSFNLWPMSVAKLGEAFGLEKLAMDVRSKAYVMRDCEIIRRAILFTNDFAEGFGIESVPNTLGGFAVKIWQSLGGENWQDPSDWSREGLFGGRVELFKTGSDSLCSYTDINSLYPWAMTQKFPTANDPVKDVDGFGLAEVTLKVPNLGWQPLPVRREDGSIFYPWGKLRGVWTFAEIQTAVARGCKLLKIHEAKGSKEGRRYYQEYVREIYKRRLRSKSEAEKLQLKLLLNNLYGQLAMGGKVTRSVDIRQEEREVSRYIGTEIPNCYGQKKLIDVQVPLPDHVNISHAAYVTSLGRLRLGEFAAKVGTERLVYCDTDSLIFEGEPPFKTDLELGEMKLEGQSHCVRVFLPKVYEWDGKTKAKGVPRRLAEKFVKEKRVEYEQPFRFRESVRFYDRGNERPMSVWRTVSKELLAVYDKKTLKGDEYLPLQFSGKSCLLDEIGTTPD